MKIPDHVLVVNPRGTLENDDIERLDQQILEKLARYQRIGIVGNLEQLQRITTGAVATTDAAAERPGYVADWHRFPRVAVIASGEFVTLAVEAIGKSLPQVQLRAFEPAELDQAISFASAFDPGDARAEQFEVGQVEPGRVTGAVTEELTEDG